MGGNRRGGIGPNDASAMKKNLVKILIVVLLTAVFVYFFTRSVKWGEVLRYVQNVNVGLFVLLFPLSALHFLTRGFRWRYLLIHEKRDVRLAPLVAGNVVGFTVTFLFPGRLGEIVKPIYVARKENIRTGFAIGTVVVERLFDMFTMCLFLGIFLLAKPLYADFFALSAESAKRLTFWGIIGVAFASSILAVALLLYFFKSRAVGVVGRLLRPFPEKFRSRVLSLLLEFIDGLKFFHSAGNLILYTLLSFVVWLAILLFYWVFFLAFHVQIPYFVLVPYIFLTMVGASIPTPGMVGGFDYFSKLGMTSFYGVDPNLAVGMTLVTHTIQVVVTCALGYVILWREGMSLFQLKRMGERTER
jgi:uncharacterized protein (TIRG00374 family)